jgi:hypothetical protein
MLLMIFVWIFLVRVMLPIDMGGFLTYIMCQTLVPICCLFLS